MSSGEVRLKCSGGREAGHFSRRVRFSKSEQAKVVLGSVAAGLAVGSAVDGSAVVSVVVG